MTEQEMRDQVATHLERFTSRLSELATPSEMARALGLLAISAAEWRNELLDALSETQISDVT